MSKGRTVYRVIFPELLQAALAEDATPLYLLAKWVLEAWLEGDQIFVFEEEDVIHVAEDEEDVYIQLGCWLDELLARKAAQDLAQLPGSAAEDVLSPQQIKEHYESESLVLVKSTMANSGFKNVYLINKGVHSGKYIACAVNQVDDSTYESLGIFESREQAALQYARHIGSEEAAALAATYKEKEEAAAQKEATKKSKKKQHASESSKKRPQELPASPRRVRNRLRQIVKGTAGFADMSRKSFRDLGGATFVIEGTISTRASRTPSL